MVIPKIKICGLISVEDAKILNHNSVEYAGIVLFYPKSKRHQEIEQAKLILKALDAKIKKVAVTVSPTLEQVREIEAAGFDILQVHGELLEEVLQETKLDIFKAFHLQEDSTLPIGFHSDKMVGYVFDGKLPGQGEAFDWSILQGFDRKNKLLMLAGGLSSQNVQQGIDALTPDIVDVSSGVEKGTGIGKDADKIKAFVEQARMRRK